MYGQCGGQAWRGPTCCLPGSACVIEEAAVAGSYGEGSVGGAYAFAGGAYSRCLPEPSADPITGMLSTWTASKRCLQCRSGVALHEKKKNPVAHKPKRPRHSAPTAHVHNRLGPPFADPEDIDVLRITLADTLAGLKAGVFTSETLTKAFLAQIAKYEPLYNAFTFLNPFALSQARTSDRRRAAGARTGAMEGVRCGPVLTLALGRCDASAARALVHCRRTSGRPGLWGFCNAVARTERVRGPGMQRTRHTACAAPTAC